MSDTATSLTELPKPGRHKRPWPLALVALGAGALIWGGVAFADFVRSVNALSAPSVLAADGIVVVTGGSSRIEVALQLLEDGVAKRMLISGVHDQTQAEQLVARTRAEPALFACCVELDHAALDTLGNARETARWAQGHKLQSLVVVTSAYHIPRTTQEIARKLPGVELIPFPINPASEDRRASAHGENPWPVSLLAREFVKLQLARVRHLVGASG